MTSAISLYEGIIIATDLNSTFKLSGNSVLPAYPGFIVIRTLHVGLSGILSRSLKLKCVLFYNFAIRISMSCCAITESTSTSILLNSSRQAHAPVYASPENNRAIILYSTCSEQLKTTHRKPSPLARSLVDSVLPVPAGPEGDALNLIFIAPVMVSQHLSVNGVIKSREVAPMYSNP